MRTAIVWLALTGVAAAAPDFDFFVRRVEPIFTRPRADGGRCVDCHSLESNKAAFHLAPLGPDGKWTEEASRRNFENASALIVPGEPAKSRLLRHPLAEEAGGDPFHSGGKFWKSQDDPEWQTLAEWVRGARARVPEKRPIEFAGGAPVLIAVLAIAAMLLPPKQPGAGPKS